MGLWSDTYKICNVRKFVMSEIFEYPDRPGGLAESFVIEPTLTPMKAILFGSNPILYKPIWGFG